MPLSDFRASHRDLTHCLHLQWVTYTVGLWNIPLKRRGTKYDSYCAQYKHLAKRTDFSFTSCLFVAVLAHRALCEQLEACFPAQGCPGTLPATRTPPTKVASRPSPQQTDLPRKALVLCKSWKFERWILAYTGVEFKGVSSITSSISALKSGLGMCLYHWCALVLLVPGEYDPVCPASSEGSGRGGSLLTPAHLSWHLIP